MLMDSACVRHCTCREPFGLVRQVARGPRKIAEKHSINQIGKDLKIEEVNFNLRKRLIFSVNSSTIIVKYQTKRKP